MDNEPLDSQCTRLAVFITTNFQGEPSQPDGAIDTAIRLLGAERQRARDLHNALHRVLPIISARVQPGRAALALLARHDNLADTLFADLAVPIQARFVRELALAGTDAAALGKIAERADAEFVWPYLKRFGNPADLPEVSVRFGQADHQVRFFVTPRHQTPLSELVGDAVICILSAGPSLPAAQTLGALADEGLTVLAMSFADSMKSQIRGADKLKARYLVTVGDAFHPRSPEDQEVLAYIIDLEQKRSMKCDVRDIVREFRDFLTNR